MDGKGHAHRGRGCKKGGCKDPKINVGTVIAMVLFGLFIGLPFVYYLYKAFVRTWYDDEAPNNTEEESLEEIEEGDIAAHAYTEDES